MVRSSGKQHNSVRNDSGKPAVKRRRIVRRLMTPAVWWLTRRYWFVVFLSFLSVLVLDSAMTAIRGVPSHSSFRFAMSRSIALPKTSSRSRRDSIPKKSESLGKLTTAESESQTRAGRARRCKGQHGSFAGFDFAVEKIFDSGEEFDH